MKKIFSFSTYFLISFTTFQVNAQTYIGPTVGLDFSSIKEKPNDILFEVFDNGYSNKTFFYGLRIEQQLNNRISLALKGNYTKKEVNALINNFIPMKGFEFEYYRSSLTANWSVFNNWAIGIGPTYHWIKDIQQVTINAGIKAPYMGDKREYGGTFTIGFKHWNFLFELNYNKGFKLIEQKDDSGLLKPINSFGVSINYMIRVLNWGKGKKVYCPKL